MKKSILFVIFMAGLGWYLQAQRHLGTGLSEGYQYPTIKKSLVEYPVVEKPAVSSPIRTKVAEDWWEPDTLWLYASDIEFREVFEYNNNGFLERYYDQIADAGKWINRAQELFTYDENDNLLTDLWQDWKEGEWVNYSLMTYEYDSRNNLLSEIRQLWEKGNWKNVHKYTYTYDGSDNVLSELRQLWNGADWVNVRNTTYSYDANNKVLMDYKRVWREGNWADSLKDVYTYDDKQLMSTRTHENFDVPEKGTFRLTFTYDKRENLTYRLYEGWNGAEWFNQENFSCTYDGNNNMLSQLIQIWGRGNWKDYAYLTYEYDDRNNPLMELIQEKGETDEWEDMEKWSFQYDLNDNIINVIYEPFRNYPYENNMQWSHTWDGGHNMLTNIVQYRNIEHSEWSNLEKFEYIYDDQKNCTVAEHWSWTGGWVYNRAHDLSVTYNDAQSTFAIGGGFYKVALSYTTIGGQGEAIAPVSDELISIYPNPTSGKIIFSIADVDVKQVSLYNQLGQKIMEQAFVNENVLEIGHYPSGVYLLLMETTQGNITKKIIKQ